MTRSNLEHLIRATGTIADDTDIVIIGSQAVLGQYPAADARLPVSREADVYPRDHPERSDLIDGSIGEGSPFEREFGYYAHGVDASTAVLPDGWQDRLVLVSGPNTRDVRGWCLEVHYLAVAKLVAGREKDLDFLRVLHQGRYITAQTVLERLRAAKIDVQLRPMVEARLARIQQENAA